MKDPLVIKGRMESKNLKFAIRKIDRKILLCSMKKIKKKKSSGSDGLSQEQLVMGANTLAAPLLEIIIKSLASGEFDSKWKEAQITPVLKTGHPESVDNYRPVSCFTCSFQVIRKLVHAQLCKHLVFNLFTCNFLCFL